MSGCISKLYFLSTDDSSGVVGRYTHWCSLDLSSRPCNIHCKVARGRVMRRKYRATPSGRHHPSLFSLQHRTHRETLFCPLLPLAGAYPQGSLRLRNAERDGRPEVGSSYTLSESGYNIWRARTCSTVRIEQINGRVGFGERK